MLSLFIVYIFMVYCWSVRFTGIQIHFHLIDLLILTVNQCCEVPLKATLGKKKNAAFPLQKKDNIEVDVACHADEMVARWVCCLNTNKQHALFTFKSQQRDPTPSLILANPLS